MKFSALLTTALVTSSIFSVYTTKVHAAKMGGSSDPIVLCTDGTATYDGAAFDACTREEGNANPTAATAFLNTGVFDSITSWIFDEKINTPGAIEPGTDLLGFDIDPKTGTTSGNWGFSNTSYTGPIVLELKASQGRSYYFFEEISGAASLLGTWNTNGVDRNNKNKPQDLSHASLFYVEDGLVQPVPEPMTVLGTMAALGMGALFKRKKDA